MKLNPDKYTQEYLYHSADILYVATRHFTDNRLEKEEPIARHLLYSAMSCRDDVVVANKALEEDDTAKAIEYYSLAYRSVINLEAEYRRFAEQAGLEVWTAEKETIKALKESMKQSSPLSYEQIQEYVEHSDDTISINVIISAAEAVAYLLSHDILTLAD